MPQLTDVDAIVIDIEGTTSQTSHVFDVMFPYARVRIADWVNGLSSAERDSLRTEVAALLSVTELSDADLIAALEKWSDDDIKAAPLKSIQGQIWARGFAAGELFGHLFEDVAPALSAWHAAGKQLYVFSSGSVQAQQSWFGHSIEGDLTPYFSGFFDTVSAGNKRAADAYRAITAAIGVAPERTLFLSDVPEELDAAVEAGWQVVGLARDGEPHAERMRASKYAVVNTFTSTFCS